MIPEYKPIEKGIVIREVVNPKPISKFPEADRRDMHLRYTVSQMIQEGYDEMEFVEFHTVIKYELVPEEGFDNLYDAYVDWMERLNQESVGFIIIGVYNAVNPLFMDTAIKLKLKSKKAVETYKLNGASYRDTYGSLSIDYEIKRGKGHSDLWQAYMAWWDKNEKLTSYWNKEVAMTEPSWKSQPFYSINPIKEKEKTMIYTINAKEIRKTICCTKDYIRRACNKLSSMSFEPGDKCQNSLQIASEIKQISNDIERAVNHLKFLGELQGASSIQMNEQEYARFNIDLSAE